MNGKEVTRIRKKLGLNTKECAEILGSSLRSWQKKEEVNTQNSSNLSKLEWEFFLLLANEHPDYILTKRNEN